MHRSTSYNFWQQDSELYLHVKASSAEHLHTITSHEQSTSQPHQHVLHSVLENTAYHPTPVVSQHHVACDADSTTEDQIVVPCDDVPDAGISPIPIAQGDIHIDATGWCPHHVPSSYSPHAFSDYLPAHSMGFSDVNLPTLRKGSSMTYPINHKKRFTSILDMRSAMMNQNRTSVIVRLCASGMMVMAHAVRL
ncbi:uncharacterized protein F5891DRAFT_481703 [Suillus fuscotomentosus]|uniref:Uncharacterized protein n=1 Tax=Suillus fuscotomentosus TaxID=1912939 RepID=A0AAD4E234_9AGAM|nr:uncharacterized protein F5891DRAFT_481703 [Suillus fuscotomentosus]KAG1898315.1 hypothetical protein F5891DRAFT_481703 [Suillus fuscotomentosus]